jgi:hypothetical protein
MSGHQASRGAGRPVGIARQWCAMIKGKLEITYINSETVAACLCFLRILFLLAVSSPTYVHVAGPATSTARHLFLDIT